MRRYPKGLRPIPSDLQRDEARAACLEMIGLEPVRGGSIETAAALLVLACDEGWASDDVLELVRELVDELQVHGWAQSHDEGMSLALDVLGYATITGGLV